MGLGIKVSGRSFEPQRRCMPSPRPAEKQLENDENFSCSFDVYQARPKSIQELSHIGPMAVASPSNPCMGVPCMVIVH